MISSIKPILTEIPAEFREWDSEQTLVSYDESDAEYANGFGSSDIVNLFPQVREHWHNFFERFDVTLSPAKFQTSFVFPKTADRVLPVIINGEANVIAVNRKEVKSLASEAGLGSIDQVVDAFADYLMRRLVVSVVASWEDERRLEFSFPEKSDVDEIDIVGVVVADYALKNSSFRLVVGLSPTLTDLLNDVSRKTTIRSNASRFTSLNKHELDAELLLCGLDLDHSEVIELLKPENVLELPGVVPVSCFLTLSGELYAKCTLSQSGGALALTVDKVFDAEKIDSVNSLSLGSFKLAQVAAFEGLIPGGLIMTSLPVPSSAYVQVRDETVATVTLGNLGRITALRVESN